ncbi:hypothetical protein F5Y19DRAFT_414389 [Xylariaceae sp. FL1651]|nr:hypothetical protein F5Y19DRAFT_414389 [Xylariaceae sp. FL1651]
MATPTAADVLFDPTQDTHPNRWNLGLPFGLYYKERCVVRTNLLRCGGCRAVMYCGFEHQRADRPRHKNQCKVIKPALEELAAEEAKLRAKGAEALAYGWEDDAANTGNSDGNDGEEDEKEDPFTSSLTRGRFYYISSTRPCMQARHNLISATLNVRTGEAADIALANCLEMLQLCRGDNMGVREQVPSLFLRLDRDQEAYDFIKWWMVLPRSYVYTDNTLPFLDLKGKDAFEPPKEEWLKSRHDVSHTASLTHLKIRLLLDVRMLAK